MNYIVEMARNAKNTEKSKKIFLTDGKMTSDPEADLHYFAALKEAITTNTCTGKKIKFPEENYNRTCKGHIFDEFPVSELYRTSHISLQIFFCAGQYCMSFTLPASGQSIFSCSYCVMQELTM